MIVFIIQLAVIILTLAGVWCVFTKAGKPGWAALIPFYNFFVMLEIAGKPGWWLVLILIPIVNIVIGIITLAALAAKFSKGAGFVVGLILLPFVFYPILGFGDAKYQATTPPPVPGS